MLLLFALAGSGCALFSKGDVTEPRFFAPSAAPRERAASARPAGTEGAAKLRIGRIRGGDHLRQRIVFRSSAVEIGEYPHFRWTEKPEEYVRRALLQALFEERGITQAVGGAVPTLDVEVLAFEEVRRGDQRAARVEIGYAVRDDRVVIAAHTVVVERPAPGGPEEMEPVIEALSAALAEASSTIASEIAAALPVKSAD